MNSVYFTDKGKVRQHNEDSVGVFSNQHGDRLAIVADGMGGHRAGDVASSMAISLLKNRWEQTDKIETADNAEEWLKENVEQVNTELFTHAKQHSECEGMGTTLVAAICTNLFLTVVNIGDSRGYLFNNHGINQITDDHSLVNELVKSGQISAEDAEHHPRKNVLLRALGTEPNVTMDIRTIMFEEEDYLILCSDGLSNKVSKNDISEMIRTNEDLEDAARSLIDLANQNGGEDNISVVIIEYAAETESG